MARKPKKQPKPKLAPEERAQLLQDKEQDLAEKKAKFLELYMETGRVDLATKQLGVGYQYPYFWAKTDDKFKADWHDARAVVGQRVEDGAYRRAVTGTLKPVYQRGMLVGTVREWSDSLTITLLKGLKPEVYRERVDLQSSGKDGGPIQHEVGFSDHTADMMRRKVFGLPAPEPEGDKK